jgi:hypothetical protein
MRVPRLVLVDDDTARAAHEQLVELGLPGAPVGDEQGIFRGSVDVDRVERAMPDELVRSLSDGRVTAVPQDATLDEVVEVFATEHVAWVPVLDAGRRIVGVVGTADLVGAYRRSLAGNLRSLRSIFSGSIFVEAEVGSASAVAGRRVADAGWPPGAVVVAIQRGEQLIFPEPGTEIRGGDVVSALVPKTAEDRLRMVLGADATPNGEADDLPMI